MWTCLSIKVGGDIQIENDLTVFDNKRKFMQIFDLFSDLHQARMRGRGRGKWRERGEDEEGKEAKLEK